MWSIVKVNVLRWRNGKRDFNYVEASKKRYKTDIAAKAALRRMGVPFDTRMAAEGEYWTICKVEDDYLGAFKIILNHEESIFVETHTMSFIQK
ncbi:hypothetical protein [Paenibacillus naphthalenovorans]|uniref:hypothetical protein n=1 Tax=Paenibacillus naphthalenovorans TaxID=162209 RepID=UPI003D2A4CAB